MKKWFEEKKKNGALIGLIGAPLAWLIAGVALTFLFVSCETKADWLLPEGPVVYLYVDAPINTPFCEGGGDELTSNLGIRQLLYENRHIGITTNYTHHSCAFLKDKNEYDAIGLGIEWRIGK